MDWVETTGRSLEEAKEAALDQLGVHEEDAEFVILSEPKTGLFGRTRGEARVRARVKPTQPRPKRTRSSRHRQRRSDAQRKSGAGSADVGRSAAGSVALVEDGNGETEPSEKSQTRSSSSRRRSRSRSRSSSGESVTAGAGSQPANRGGNAKASAPASEPGPKTPKNVRSSNVEEDEHVEELSLAEQGDSAKSFVEGLLREIGLDATVTTRVVDSETASVEVAGDGLGILIGPGGATLGALQELTRTYVQHRTAGRSERIIVDVAGYRARRAEALQRFAHQIAEEVLDGGSERRLEPMSPSDRKVVHDAVNEIEGVSTRSEGEEPRRYIVIAPVKLEEPSH